MNFKMAATAVALLAAAHAHAGLIGTTLSLRTLAQATPTSPPINTAFERTVVVSEPAVEFPDVASLFNPGSTPPPGFANSLVNTAINVGNDFITIDFDNVDTRFTNFASAFQNSYVFKFESAALVDIVGAELDASTNIGLDTSDLRFAGNELTVNFESLPFNRNSFARINLQVTGGPTRVSEPATLLSVALALGVLGLTRRRTK